MAVARHTSDGAVAHGAVEVCLDVVDCGARLEYLPDFHESLLYDVIGVVGVAAKPQREHGEGHIQAVEHLLELAWRHHSASPPIRNIEKFTDP